MKKGINLNGVAVTDGVFFTNGYPANIADNWDWFEQAVSESRQTLVISRDSWDKEDWEWMLANLDLADAADVRVIVREMDEKGNYWFWASDNDYDI